MNFHSLFRSPRHCCHTLAASSKLSHFSHRAEATPSTQAPPLSVHLHLRCLRTWRRLTKSPWIDRRLAVRALKRKGQDRQKVYDFFFWNITLNLAQLRIFFKVEYFMWRSRLVSSSEILYPLASQALGLKMHTTTAWPIWKFLIYLSGFLLVDKWAHLNRND